jgi:hypothetical protein
MIAVPMGLLMLIRKCMQRKNSFDSLLKNVKYETYSGIAYFL